MAKPNVLEEVEIYDILSKACGQYIGMAAAAILSTVRKELTKSVGDAGNDPQGLLANAKADFRLTDHQAALLQKFSEAEVSAVWTKLTESIDIGINFVSILPRAPTTYGWSAEPGEKIIFEDNSDGQISPSGSWEVDVDLGFVHVGWKS